MIYVSYTTRLQSGPLEKNWSVRLFDGFFCNIEQEIVIRILVFIGSPNFHAKHSLNCFATFLNQSSTVWVWNVGFHFPSVTKPPPSSDIPSEWCSMRWCTDDYRFPVPRIWNHFSDGDRFQCRENKKRLLLFFFLSNIKREQSHTQEILSSCMHVFLGITRRRGCFAAPGSLALKVRWQ